MTNIGKGCLFVHQTWGTPSNILDMFFKFLTHKRGLIEKMFHAFVCGLSGPLCDVLGIFHPWTTVSDASAHCPWGPLRFRAHHQLATSLAKTASILPNRSPPWNSWWLRPLTRPVNTRAGRKMAIHGLAQPSSRGYGGSSSWEVKNSWTCRKNSWEKMKPPWIRNCSCWCEGLAASWFLFVCLSVWVLYEGLLIENRIYNSENGSYPNTYHRCIASLFE